MAGQLRVVVTDFKPLIFSEENVFKGFEIELWEKIAHLMGKSFAYKEVSFPDVLKNVTDGTADVGLGGITVNEEREEQLDFSHPIMRSGLRIMVRKERGNQLIAAMKLFREEIAPLLFSLGIFIFIVANIAWFVERNAGVFTEGYVQGIFEAIYWTVVTISTVGYGDFSLTTFWGRLLSMAVIFVGLAIFSAFVARMSALSTVESLATRISSSKDLRGKRIATRGGTISVEILERLNALVVPFNEIERAYSALHRSEVDAVVFDAPVLLHHVQNVAQGHFTLTGELFDEQNYAFAVPQGSFLREDIDRALLTLRENGEYDALYKKWFGKKE